MKYVDMYRKSNNLEFIKDIREEQKRIEELQSKIDNCNENITNILLGILD